MSRLLVRRLAKQFPGQLLFRDLSFSLEAGMVAGITGSNGSGKSTLLRILAGVLQPNAGEVVLSSKEQVIGVENRPLHTGFVAPYLQVYSAFTARENLRFQVRARRLNGGASEIARVLDRVRLLNRADDPVGTYSSGMYQRLRLAAALLVRPLLLLLDEPFSNLDEAGRRVVDEIMREQRAEGTLQVMATNTAEYTDRCDKIVCVEDYRPS